jgi:Cof subfamily protein (haloacid dehalogenase superfamily)
MTTNSQYKLLALDVDGTLLSARSELERETIDAVAAVQQAGIRVCLATGRSYVETIDVWRQLKLREPHEPMVLIGGALVSEAGTGRTLSQRGMDRDVACEFADVLCGAGYSAMAIMDVWRWGVDYLLAESSDADDVMRRWFGQMAVKVRRVRRMADALDAAPLRVSAVVSPADGPRLVAELAERFGQRLNVHSILAPNYGVHIVEAFSPACSKWEALKYVAQAYRIGSGQIVAVGDDVNDLPMIRGAGLGAAMAKAPPSVQQVADVTVEHLPDFLHRLARGGSIAS